MEIVLSRLLGGVYVVWRTQLHRSLLVIDGAGHRDGITVWCNHRHMRGAVLVEMLLARFDAQRIGIGVAVFFDALLRVLRIRLGGDVGD